MTEQTAVNESRSKYRRELDDVESRDDFKLIEDSSLDQNASKTDYSQRYIVLIQFTFVSFVCNLL